MKKPEHTSWLFSVFTLVLFSLSAFGAPYGEQGAHSQFSQPDGTVIDLRFFGDEFYAVTETADGYVLLFDPATKAYFYAALSPDGNEFLSSGVLVRAGDDPEALGFERHLRISAESRRTKAKKNFEFHDGAVRQTEAWAAKKQETRNRLNRELLPQDASSVELSPSLVTLGEKVGITILVDFSDAPGTVAVTEIDDFFNKPGYDGFGNAGSVFDYYYTQSARKLRFNNVVSYYVRMPEPKSYYNNTSLSAEACGRFLLKAALAVLVDEGFDFSACTTAGEYIEGCNLLFSGGASGVWNAGLWPHRGSLYPTYTVGDGLRIRDYQISGIGSYPKLGTICHEIGHMICYYPDLYDYGDDSEGSGKYSLMGMGNLYTQTDPIGVGAYLRYHSGWVDVVTLTSNMNERCSVRVDEGRIYRYDIPEPAHSWADEYFLLENRAKIGWEATSGLPDEGLLIMHCDEAGNRDAQQMTEDLHYECSIEQADNDFDLERNSNRGDGYDLFHSGGIGPNTAFGDITSPNAHGWKAATTSTVSGVDSRLNIHSISAAGETMTFVIGAGAPSGTPEIGIDQSFIYMEGDYGTDAPPVSFAVWNRQGGTLDYMISTHASWLSVSPSAGTATTESDVIELSFNSAGLAPGIYNGKVIVSDSGAANSPQTTDVQLVVFDQPSIGVNSNSYAVSGNSGDETTRVLNISNTGGGTMDYVLSGGSAWLSLGSTNGTVVREEDSIVLGFDASALVPSIYQDTVTVVSASADNSPYEIDVIFDVSTGPVIFISPTNILLQTQSGMDDSVAMVISNSGGRELTFSISDSLPPTEYSWSSSDDVDGPIFNWIDISALGFSESLGDEGESALLDIGFDFPFYGTVYSNFMIGANGCMSLTEGSVSYNNSGLPASSIPSQCFAPFWDDLNSSSRGSIRYHSTPERLVVSWLGVPRYGSSDYVTFQVVLYPDGRVLYQYENLPGTLNSCTVGLQDDDTTGPYLQMARNETFLKSGMVIEILPPQSSWLVYTAESGTVSTGTSETVWFIGTADGFGAGVYTALVSLVCNDLVSPAFDIPVTMTVSAGADADGDSIPDWWEMLYYGGETNADPFAFCSNGINSVLDAYVAGFDPTNSLAGFFVAGVPVPGGYSLNWSEVTGRVYTVYWASNLLDGFSVLQSNHMGGAVTDLLHAVDSASFYRVKVEVDP